MRDIPKSEPPPPRWPLIVLAILALFVAIICWRCHVPLSIENVTD